MMIPVRELFGDIDIYLFDQILKGRFSPHMKILDAGCGSGRNIVYFLRNGFEVFAVDRNPQAVEQVKIPSQALARNPSKDNFQISAVENIPFPSGHFDGEIYSAVLRFAENEQHFSAMLNEMWRT